MSFNWLDILLVIFLVAFVIEGFAQGFSRVVIGLISTVLGILFAAWTYGVAGSFFEPFVKSRAISNVIGFIVVFVVIQILGAILAWGVSRLFKWTGLSPLDRALGGLFGAVKAALIGIAFVMLLMAFPLKQVPESVAGSRIAPYAIESAQVLSYIAPREFTVAFQATYDRLKEFWADNVPPHKKRSAETATF